MPSDVDAVIAALRIVLRDAETHTSQHWWNTEVVNRWIGQLPGAWTGRWNRLLLEPRWSGNTVAYREPVLTHLRSTLAYLEVNRDAIKARRVWRWPLRAGKPEPIDAEFKVVAEPTEKPTKKPGKSMRLIKGGESRWRRGEPHEA